MKASRAPPTASTAPSWRRGERVVGEGGNEQLLDQHLRQPAAAAVRQLHRRVVGERHRAGAAEGGVGGRLVAQ